MTLRIIIIAVIAWWTLIIGGIVYAGGACSAEPEAWVGPRHYDDPRVLDMVRPVRAVRREPQVRAYVRREEEPKRDPLDRLKEDHMRPRCYPAVRTVGDQHVSTDGAKGEAIKAWSQQVRHDFGERAMDFDVAEHASFACVRSSIGSALGQVFHRCEVVARPCHPQHQPREK